jgi:hypothetical protein
MTTPRGLGWGGARKGAGRPRGRRDRTYAELIEAAKRELATGEPAGIRTQIYFQIRDQVRAALDGKGEMPAAAPVAVTPALHRLFADTRADLDTRLRRIEQVALGHNRRLDEAIETLERILRHQLGIARQLGAVEIPKAPRITRSRPMS